MDKTSWAYSTELIDANRNDFESFCTGFKFDVTCLCLFKSDGKLNSELNMNQHIHAAVTLGCLFTVQTHEARVLLGVPYNIRLGTPAGGSFCWLGVPREVRRPHNCPNQIQAICEVILFKNIFL